MIKTDFLVIGSGIAGLVFALKVAEHGSVAMVTKKEMLNSNTAMAQGGIASVFDRFDSFDLHIKDTLAAGDGLCHGESVETVVKNGPERIRELMEMGVRFSLKSEAEVPDSDDFDLGREGGHSKKRIIHARDMTGIEIARVLAEHVKGSERISVFENHSAIDLITASTRMKRGSVTTSVETWCYGAYVLDGVNETIKTFCADVTLLATGGAGKAYLYTSNPDIATGDGIAMGYRAGANIANLEFVQFHPTCLYHPEAKNFLISEAVRGEGGVLLNAAGERFMEKHSPLKELACRDVVARAIDAELKISGNDSVFLDISHKPRDAVKERFPNLHEKCISFGMDMTREPIPVVPAAHYMCGGILTDMNGGTDINGLYAIGETACTGLHGANRLASNSLLEALVCAHRAAEAASREIGKLKVAASQLKEPPEWDDAGTTDSDEAIMVSHNWDEIRRLMWNYVGIVRSNKRLQRAERRVEIIQKEIHEYYWNFKVTSDLVELRNIAMLAELIIKCAKARKESRGLHYNIEYPEKNDKLWLRDTLVRRPW